jgi:hypothetical protein
VWYSVDVGRDTPVYSSLKRGERECTWLELVTGICGPDSETEVVVEW